MDYVLNRKFVVQSPGRPSVVDRGGVRGRIDGGCSTLALAERCFKKHANVNVDPGLKQRSANASFLSGYCRHYYDDARTILCSPHRSKPPSPPLIPAELEWIILSIWINHYTVPVTGSFGSVVGSNHCRVGYLSSGWKLFEKSLVGQSRKATASNIH